MDQENPTVLRLLRRLVPLLTLLALAASLVACGGSSSAGSSTDVNTLLDKTFSGQKNVKSGKLDAHLKLDVKGAGSGAPQGPIDVRVSGPFESQGKGQLPKFNLTLAFSGAGQNVNAGVENTGSKAFVNFEGQAYAVSDQIYQQFKSGYEQAQAQAQSRAKGNQNQLSKLGINPRDWLTNAKNAGDGKVGDADVVRITGGVDIPKLLDDISTALSKAGSLGLSNQQVPNGLTAAQKQQVQKAVKNVHVEIDTGKDDTILRRMLIGLTAADPNGSSGSADVSLDVQLLDVNQGQDFPEPSGAKPLDQLLQQFGGSSGLGGLLGGASGSGSSSGSGASSSGATQKKLQKYSDCVAKAGSDQAKLADCAKILG
jgi:hypothetical protein